MGLLDDLFGKEKINQLKEMLDEKSQEVALLELNLAQAKFDLNEVSNLIVEFKKIVTDRENVIESLKIDLNKQQSEILQLVSESKALKVLAAEKQSQLENTISNLKASLEKSKLDLIEREKITKSIESEWKKARDSIELKERSFQEREVKLEEKSEKLLKERQKFQQQSAELYSREQRWKQNIEPQLSKYEAHLSLELRELKLEETKALLEKKQISLDSQESDLIRRGLTDEKLRARETEVEDSKRLLALLKVELEVKSKEHSRIDSEQAARTKKLENWAEELFVFQTRVNQLDLEIKKLAEQEKQIIGTKERNDAIHKEQLVELRLHRSTLKELEKDITQRETSLNLREKIIKRDVSQLESLKGTNLELRKENKNVKLLNDSLEASNRTSLLEIKRLTRKYDVLQVSNEALQEKLKNLGSSSKIKSSLSNPTILSWMLKEGGPETTEISNGWLGITGNSPWDEYVFHATLDELGYEFYEMPDEDLEYIIVGRKGWSKSELIDQIESREGESLRIYSQEMFFAKLVTGKDPFDTEDIELLNAFAEDHPALQFLMSLPEPWPFVTTDEPIYISEFEGNDYGESESPLHILGYRVGATSKLSVKERREILTQCFKSIELPFCEDADAIYIQHWGRGTSAKRLFRMADHIKWLANRMGKDPRKPQARLDWISDLNWLKEKYYNAYKTRFIWPNV